MTEVFLTLTEVFSCFFLNFKANVRVKLAKTGHDPHYSTLFVICVVVRLLFVLSSVVFACKCVLPPGDNPSAVIYIYHITSPNQIIIKTENINYQAVEETHR
jgi:hypothetical protein